MTAIAATSPTRPSTAVDRGRIQWLDALRGIAALAVVAGHGCALRRSGVGRYCGRTFHTGHAAVIASFAIGGYIIPVSIERS